MRCLVALLMLASASAQAGEIVFYRCTDASGALTVQNMPCPKGMQTQSRKVMQAVETPPPPPPLAVPPPPALPQLMAAPVVAPPEPAKPVVVAPPPVPLPDLFQCRTREGQTYFSESSEPPSRCVAMQVTGLDGNPNTGAGEACEVMRDTCTAIDPAQRCATWQQWVNEAESAWRFAAASQAEQLQKHHQRLQSLLEGSDCSTQKP
ncbi:MAG: DUF4124 domain-containing protein [Stenotrophomonas sp.]|uniref:DUF4124 domain-containing protein n=1 Tax=Stenotrophomonas sp. TaxID=69392 RepID=UPI0028B0DB48|nr:DUF4124 domain-containing protein [Stenotrophomonas sp.]